MSDLQAQLDELRQRMAAASARAAQQVEQRLAERVSTIRTTIEEIAPGNEVQTAFGQHYETGKSWDLFRRHGNMEISRLRELPPDLLCSMMDGARHAHPERWAFLDTETTGLVGGAGTCAFLVGIGRITTSGFEVRQFFMRDYPEERSMLAAINAALEDVDVLVTYNGKTFDLPLLETRYRQARTLPRFAKIPHLDLLHGARRLWRLRFESCRLVELEYQLLGHERHDDVPGDLIPQIYFDYVRTGRALRLAPVFLHNALDILSLACLTAIVPWAFRDPSALDEAHGAEMVCFARWLRQEGRLDEARRLFRRAINTHLKDELLFRTLWDLADVERKLECRDAAVEIYLDLAKCRNPYRVQAFEQLAKHYEHRERDYATALEMTECALSLETTPELERRRERLARRVGTKKTARLLEFAANG